MAPAVIAGAHTIIFAEDAEAARGFFRDVLGFPSVDAGDGRLIFALPCFVATAAARLLFRRELARLARGVRMRDGRRDLPIADLCN